MGCGTHGVRGQHHGFCKKLEKRQSIDAKPETAKMRELPARISRPTPKDTSANTLESHEVVSAKKKKMQRIKWKL